VTQLIILRNGLAQFSVAIDERTMLTHKLMGEHRIAVETITNAPIDIQIGDYIEYEGERYYLNSAPTLEKVNNFTYSYRMDFEGEIYFLYNKLFMDEGQSDFSYHGTPNDFLQLLLTNINAIQPGWSVASVDIAEPQTLTFSDDTCRTALTRIAEAFDMEYRLAGKAIYLQTSVGAATVLQFEYGRGKGLYSITRTTIDEKSLLTRVFGFGARKNLGPDYRNGSTRLVFENRYLENNQALYGVREGAVTFDDIYPNRTGSVTAVNANDPFKFVDDTIDFDLNDQLIEGTVAKVVFKTGSLAGYEFELKRYLNSVKTFELLPFEEDNGYQLPNTNFRPAIGDDYTLVDIEMPQTYIDAAEALLEQRTQEYIDENSVPRVTYAIELDEKYVKSNGIDLKIANLVNIQDADLGIDAQIRVTQVSFPLVNKYKIEAVISDTVPYTIQERLIATTVDNNVLTKNIDRRRAELARRTAARFRNLQDLVFDPDGYFDPENIKPLSIETLMLSVGAKSQNFGLAGVAISPNHAGDENQLNITGGQLIHYELNIEGLGYVWNIDPRTFPSLDPAKYYYVYAKCSKTALTGVWELSEVPRLTEDEPGQYLFNLGVLYAVVDGRRDFDFTNGMTYIAGDTITTGTIKSIDGLNFFDLSGGRFKIGNSQSSLDYGVTQPNQVTLKGSILQTPAGVNIDFVNYRGDYDNGTEYFQNDSVTFNGQTHVKYSAGSVTGIAPTNGTHWKVYAAKGDDGPQGVPGDPGADGQSLYTWIRYADDVNGTGISNDPTGKTYIGFAYNKTTPIETNNPADYIWGLMSGEGVQGPPGADGQTLYTWVKYSNNPDGSGLYDTPNANTEYIGIAVNKTTASESTNPADYTWSKFKGEQGEPGADGQDGAAGPGIVNRGLHDSGTFYYNNSLRRDVVQYSGVWYLYNGPNGAAGAFNASQWENFGGQFTSIATGLLLAESANIADWVIKSGKISSQDEFNGNPKAVLDGTAGALNLRGGVTRYSSTGAATNNVPVTMDLASGLLSMDIDAGAGQPAAALDIRPDRIRITGAYGQIGSGGDIYIGGRMAGIDADVTARHPVINASDFLAAVYGKATNTSGGDSSERTWGGYFEGLFAKGLSVSYRAGGATTLNQTDFFYRYNSSSSGTVNLPSSPKDGQVVIVFRQGSGGCTVNGNGNSLWKGSSASTTDGIGTRGRGALCIWDGTYWNYMYVGL
jgi:hypothetical protein